MNIIADLHTHTNACTHAFSTVTEMAQAAHDRGLYALAITDHGRAMEGAPGAHYFENLSLVPDTLMGVRVLKGMEANIVDFNGTLDASDKLLSMLDIVVASMHTITLFDTPSVDKCTNAYLKMCDNPHIDIIGHSGSPYYAYDYETVIKRCAETKTLVEINNSTFTGYRKDSAANCKHIAKLCKRFGAFVVVNTDAHIADSVGRFEHAVALLNEIDFPPELVVNSSIENLHSFFKEKNIAY